MTEKKSKASRLRALKDEAERRLSQKAGRPTLPAEDPTRALIHALQTHQVELEMQNEELLRAQEDIEASQAKYSELFEHAPVGYLSLDREQVINEINFTAAEMLGAPKSQLLGHSLTQFIDPRDQDRHFLCRNKLHKTGEPQVCELRLLRSGEPFFADGRCCLVSGAEGSEPQWRAVFTDAAPRREAEAVSARVQKLESLGVLAGGIAHDFNNILTAILANISLAKTVRAPGTELEELLSESEAACRTAKDLAKQLLTFARGGRPVLACVDLGPLIKETTDFAMSGSNSKCMFSIADELWPVSADRGQLEQVVQNLVTNSVQAMPAGGDLTVEAANEVVAEGVADALPAGRYVRFSIRDQGVGMPANQVGRAFEPYFSSKGQGRGLGLAVCHSIVLGHGGTIGVESDPGAGTIITVRLSAAPEGERPRKASTDAAAAVGKVSGAGRILIMEDEAMVSRVLARILQRLGYECVVVPDGAAALDKYREFREAGKRFDLVVMDLTIPGGMGGAEAIKKLKALDPDAKAVVSSSYSEDAAGAEFAAHGFAAVLPKPYTIQEVSAVLSRVLKGG